MALSYAQLESKPQIKTTITGVQRNAQTCATKKTRTQKNSDHSKRKNVKLIAAASYATPKQRAALSHKDTRDSIESHAVGAWLWAQRTQKR